MKTLLAPAAAPARPFAATGVPLMLLASALALLIAPALMPEGYSWLSHSTSESAAQGVEGAWLARFGFLLFGIAVLWLSSALVRVWARAAAWLLGSFGALMAATAAFSTRPWIAGVPFDPVEDGLHSFTATAMGFAFNLGVLVRLFQRGSEGTPGRAFDVVAIVLSTVISMLMSVLPSLDGLLQRLMFLNAYLWYGNEARLVRRRGRDSVVL